MEAVVRILLKVVSMFFKESPQPREVRENVKKPQPQPKQSISLEDYITASGRYPERANSPELTKEVTTNAVELLASVHSFLEELGHTMKVDVTSGFRPSQVNAGISNAAVRSLHMTGQAIDLMDDENQTLANLILEEANKNQQKSLLSKHGLWLEHPKHTRGVRTNWVHLDNSKKRRNRPVRVFTI
jgi:hypothetical protein